MNGDQSSLFGVGDLPDEKRELLRRVHRMQSVDPKLLSRMMAHGLVYLRMSDYKHRLTPPGREQAGL